MKTHYYLAANTCLIISVVALIMAEFGVSSLSGNWHPTHNTAIAFGVLSLAFSNMAKLIKT